MTWLVHTNKGGAKRFVDYGLMFDSRRSLSLEYDLIRSPAYLKSLELLLARLHVQRLLFTL